MKFTVALVRHWQANIRTPGVVEAFKKAHEKLTLPKFEDKISAQLDASTAELEKEAEKVIASARSNIDKLTAEKNAILNRNPMDRTTVEEFLKQNPALKKEIEDELKDNQWSV